MVRILILVPFILWMAWTPESAGPRPEELTLPTGVFFGFYLLLILFIGLYSRLLARRVSAGNLYSSLRRFNRIVQFARWIIPAWFAWGLWELGWGWTARKLLGPLGTEQWQSPGVLVGTLPALLSWMALWWAQYPADVALREQNLLFALDADLPVHAPPSFANYFSSNVRLQILFIVAPVMLILILRDAGASVLRAMGMGHHLNDWVDAGLALIPTVIVFVLAPELLRRVLHTHSLPPGSLRDRLEILCRRTGLRYRDILLWRTHHNVGNAAVMGVIPQVRYILMTDLLMETMTDEQIEAVFAHEAGHIVHRHIAWYVLFFVLVMILGSLVPESFLDAPLQHLNVPKPVVESAAALAGFGLFWLLFGLLSRRFERQADVYAARTIQMNEELVAPVAAPVLENPVQLSPPAPAPALQYRPPSYVGPYGAGIFVSALQRVAVINNIPTNARNWTHGSIAARMNYLNRIALDPEQTLRFDRFMRKLYAGLLAALVISGVVMSLRMFNII